MTSKTRSIVTTALVTATIALPLGAYAGGLKGHPHLESAQGSLNSANAEIAASAASQRKGLVRTKAVTRAKRKELHRPGEAKGEPIKRPHG